MKNPNKVTRLMGRGAASGLVFAMLAAGAWGQDITTTTIKHGDSSFDTQVKNAEVVYVEGNDLVLKLDNGRIEHFVTPDTDKFTINGRDVTVRDLTPGTKLTQTITTSTVPRYVTTVRTLKGKIWHVNAHRSLVIMQLPDGTNQSYTIPQNAKFTIGGQKKTVYDLRKGMTIEATIVTDDTHTIVEQSKAVVGQAPPPAPPAMPQEVGVLMVFHPMISPPVLLASAEEPAPVSTAAADQPASTLPKTGTLLPLAGLLGTLSVAMSLGLGTLRRALKV